MNVQKWFLHVDLDAFFASVEQLDHPEYRGKPLIVGGKPEDKRSVVSTASYEARKFGVHSAMPTAQAYKLCPQGIFVHGRMDRYAELSYQIMNIFREYSPDVEQMSIDEAFIDITGTEKLFGPPEEIAFKIKKHVKEKTGLTVSVGLAPTKYLAKIASDLSKPDGFYFVKPGNEEQFMLSLPMDKIWGAGSKTQVILKRSGLFTTRDIREQSLDTLQFLLGKSMGNFLYNSVRGLENESFSKETKNHSISAETTFEFDVTDSYAAQTTLLELCHGVMFRLLKQKCYSKTAFLKIRYDDFSTTSIQKTCDNYILTLDNYFKIISSLFQKKYENGRGIRLLGVGFDGIETNPKPQQQSLFDDGTEKKQAVEKAILNLEQKHPEIKIRKARTIQPPSKGKTFAAILMLGFLCFSGKNLLYASDNLTTQASAALVEGKEKLINDKSLTSIFDWNINQNNNLNFLFSGYYKAGITGNFISTFGFGNPFSLGASLPVFTQEIDLSALAKLNESWSFLLEFQDEFQKNTYTFEYKGKNYLNNFIFSNRNITFPDYYSAEALGYGIKGGSNEAPGFKLHFTDFESQKWNSDFLLRYDLTKSNSQTYYGNNLVTDRNININDFLYGKYFVLPLQESLLSVADIYVESESGEFTDSTGRHFKKLDSTQYQIIPGKNLIVLSNSARAQKNDNKIPQVLVTFSSPSETERAAASIGSYDASGSFLGKIQEYFSSSDSSLKLSAFTPPLTTQIQNQKAIILQQNSGFSPFSVMQTYDCGIISSADLKIIYSSSEKEAKNYRVTELTEDFSFTKEDFFYENHLYARVFNNNYDKSDYLEPSFRYPFAEEYPLSYVQSGSSPDLKLLLRTYSPVNYFDIGKKVSEGTVLVYINGNPDTGAKYDSDSGFVTLSKTVSELDKIYITWQEQGESFQHGAFIAGAGFSYNFSPYLVTDASLTGRYPLSPYTKYADSDNTEKGFAALTAGLDYKKDFLETSDKISFSIESDNTTGTYLAWTQEQSNPQTFYLGSSSGYKTKTVPVLESDHYSTPVLENENNGTIESYTGSKDSFISGYKIPLSWDFDGLSASESLWASVDISLSDECSLASADELELALKTEQDFSAFDVYLQLGINAEKTFSGETGSFIPLWKLTGNQDSKVKNGFSTDNTSWQTVTILLDDSDRAKLTSDSDLRLIIVKKQTADINAANIKGTLFIGPYEPHQAVSFVQYDKDFIVQTQSVLDNTSPSSTNLMTGNTYATKISWKNTALTGSTPSDTFITEYNYFESADFTAYRNINLDFAIEADRPVALEKTATGNNNSEGLKFGLYSSDDSQNPALELCIVQNVIEKYISKNQQWHTLTISLENFQILIDGVTIDSADYTLFTDRNIVPSKKSLSLNTVINQNFYENGTLYSGNIYYTDAVTDAVFQNKASLKLEKTDSILKFHDYSLLKDGKLFLTSSQKFSTSVSKTKDNGIFTTQNNADASINISDINLGVNLSLQTSTADTQSVTLENAGHSVETKKSLFKVLSFGEQYNQSVSDSSLQKKDYIKVNFSSLNIPFSMNVQSTASKSSFTTVQNSQAEAKLDYSIKGWNPFYTIKISANQKQKTLTAKAENTQNYFTNYSDVSKLQFSSGEEGSFLRKENLTSSVGLGLPYLNLKPELEYILEGIYENPYTADFTDKASFNFKIPFSLYKNNFTFSISKAADTTMPVTKGGSYTKDLQYLKENQTEKSWFYSTIPFYDLFDKNLVQKVKQTSGESNLYSAAYELSCRHNLFYSLKDLFIPFSTGFAVTRDIKTTEVTNDLYQFKLNAVTMALNLFGSDSSLHLMSWYAQDEITSSFTAALKLPYGQPENISFALSGYSSILFYIDSSNQIKAGFDGSFATDGDWMLRLSGRWNHKGTDSLLIMLPSLLFPKLNEMSRKISRQETLNLTFENQSSLFKQSLEYTHSCDIKFGKYTTITSGIGSGFGYSENTLMSLSLNYSVGIKLEF